MTRASTKLPAMVWATVHHPDGDRQVRVDGLMDLGVWPERRDYLRRGIEAASGTLDTTDADTAWAQRQRARARYDAAFMAWMEAGAPAGGHPGGLEDWAEL